MSNEIPTTNTITATTIRRILFFFFTLTETASSLKEFKMATQKIIKNTPFK